jgi:integrase
MPTIALNDRAVAALKPAAARIDYFDRSLPGFGIRVSPAGQKTWQLLHRINGRLQRLTLRDPKTDVSTYPTLTLARARELAREALQGSSVGDNVGAARKLARERSFSTLADLYIEKHAKRKKRSWREDARLVRSELEAWKDRPAASIRRADVRELLEAIVGRGSPVTANRVLALVRKILNFAIDQEWVEANVAAKMARPAAEQSRDRVLTADEIRSVWTWLDRELETDAGEQATRELQLNQDVLQLRLITAQRGGEVIDMRWQDVDLVDAWWTIPAERAKNGLPHRVPLSAMAATIIAARLATANAKAVYVFAGIRGKNHRHGLLEGAGLVNVRPHDFRRTAASMMASGGIPRLTIAKILNHVDSSITAVYDRHSYDPEKRAALDWWAGKLASIIGGTEGKVLPFTRGA